MCRGFSVNCQSDQLDLSPSVWIAMNGQVPFFAILSETDFHCAYWSAVRIRCMPSVNIAMRSDFDVAVWSCTFNTAIRDCCSRVRFSFDSLSLQELLQPALVLFALLAEQQPISPAYTDATPATTATATAIPRTLFMATLLILSFLVNSTSPYFDWFKGQSVSAHRLIRSIRQLGMLVGQTEPIGAAA
jgi:hypothetical protein